jgi:hypothetical protein
MNAHLAAGDLQDDARIGIGDEHLTAGDRDTFGALRLQLGEGDRKQSRLGRPRRDRREAPAVPAVDDNERAGDGRHAADLSKGRTRSPDRERLPTGRADNGPPDEHLLLGSHPI